MARGLLYQFPAAMRIENILDSVGAVMAGVGGVGAVGGAMGGAMGAGAVSGPAGFAGIGGAAGAGAIGGAGAAGATGATSAAGAAGGIGGASVNAMQGAASASAQQMQQLMQLLKDFSSADILLALMLMQGVDSRHRCHGVGDGALMGLLTGLAYAGQINPLSHSTGSHNASSGVPSVGYGSSAGGVGMHINAHG